MTACTFILNNSMAKNFNVSFQTHSFKFNIFFNKIYEYLITLNNKQLTIYVINSKTILDIMSL